jgi:hypothetical protein
MPAAIDAGSEGCYGPPAVVGRTGPAEGLDRAEEFAEPEGRAVPLPDGRAAEALAPDAVAAGALDGAEACGLDRRPEAAVVDGLLRVAGAVAGPNVATDSMAPATRQTARMLASSGITAPCPANGLASLRSLLRRRRARSSRW